MKRIFYWDNLKGLLIALVVCGHLCERYIDDSYLLEHIWTLIYSFHMPLFIFVNGYFARLSSKPAEKKSLKMLGYYIMMQCIFVVGNYLILGKEFKISILANPSYCCWYLLFLVYAYLIAKFWPKDIGKLKQWFVGSLILSILAGFDTSIGHIFTASRAFYFMPYFLLGAVAAEPEIRQTVLEKKYTPAEKTAASVILLVGFAVLWNLVDIEWFNRKVFSGRWDYAALYPEHISYGFLGRIAAYIIAILIGYIILKLIPYKRKALSFLGRHSLLIYLVHIFVLPMEFHLISDIQFIKNKEINSAVILLILAASSAIICCIISLSYRFFIKHIFDYAKKLWLQKVGEIKK